MHTIHAFFDWLMVTSLRASALVLLVWAVQTALRRHLSPRWCYALWLPVLIVLLTPVLPESRWSVESVLWTQPPVQPAMPLPVLDVAISDSLPTALPVQQPAARPVDWKELRLLAWVSGVALALLVGGWSFGRELLRYRRAEESAGAALVAQLHAVAQEVGLRHAPRLLVAPNITSPAVTGLLRPVLLLPSDFERAFTPAEARLILRHELTHLKRGDLPLNTLLCVLMALHWFNPLLWFAFFKVRADREAACDAQVLEKATPQHRSEYGHALLKIESAFAPMRLSLGFIGILQRRASLRARIRSIASPARTRPLAGFLVTLCISGMTFLGITRAEKPAPAPQASSSDLMALEIKTISFSQESSWDFGGRLGAPPDPKDQSPTQGLDFHLQILSEKELGSLLADTLKQPGARTTAYPRMITEDGKEVVIRSVVNQPIPSRENGRDVVQYMPIGFIGKFILSQMPEAKISLGIDITHSRIIGEEKIEGRSYPVGRSQVYSAPVELSAGLSAVIYGWDEPGQKDGKTQKYRPVMYVVTPQVIDPKAGGLPSGMNLTHPAKDSGSFAVGKSAFRPGDSVVITSMTRSDDMLTVGLDYELSSTEEATAALYLSARGKASDGKAPPFDPKQRALVKRGRGSIVLHHPLPASGLPHVTFYDTKTKQPIGGIYFGTAAEAADSETLDLSYLTVSAKAPAANPTDFIKTKLNEIILPKVQFQGATVDEALEYLRVKSRALSPDPTAPGVSIIYRQSDPPSKAVISLDLKDVPLGEALRYVVELANLKMSIQPYAVLILPADDPKFAKSAAAASALNPPDKLGEIVITAEETSIDPSTEIQTAKGDARCQVGNTSVQAAELILDRRAHQLKIRGPFTIISDGSQKRSSASSDSTAVVDLDTGRLSTIGPHSTELITPLSSKIIFPSIDFRDATLAEILDFIRTKSRELDPDKKGAVIVLAPGSDASTRISLSLKNAPLSEVMTQCANLAAHKLSYHVNTHSYHLSPAPKAPANATEAKAAELRKARPQQYDFAKANLGDVLRFLATDAGINFFALPDDNPINQKLVTFSIRGSPFETLETLCRSNGLVLLLDQGRWFIRAADDPQQIGKGHVIPPAQASVETNTDNPELIGKGYVLPHTQASVEIILKDISSILDGGEKKPAADKPRPSVQFKKEQNSFYVKASRLQHTWISAYFQGLSSSAKASSTK